MLDQVDSTNAEAARRAGDNRLPTWILGLRQTQGRGRRGRPWTDPEGNFAATLLMYPSESPQIVALRSFVAALALRQALDIVTGGAAQTALKWPNDVLLSGGKVAGILLEASGQPAKPVSYLAIGIGVNLRHAPPTTSVEAGAIAPTSLHDAAGVTISPEEFLNTLATAYAQYEAVFVAQGFAPIRREWLSHAARIGTQITARTARDSKTGIFETIDDQGNLILQTEAGPEAISAADIFF